MIHMISQVQLRMNTLVEGMVMNEQQRRQLYRLLIFLFDVRNETNGWDNFINGDWRRSK